MNQKETALFFSKLIPKDKSYFLALLSHDLTAYARDTYEIESEEVAEPKKLRFYNEIHHKIAGKLRATIIEDENCYPDDVFIQIIFQLAEYARLVDELNTSIKRATEMLGRQSAKLG